MCRRKIEKPSFSEGGRGDVIPSKKIKQGVTQACATGGKGKVPKSPPAPIGGGESAGRKRKEHDNPTLLFQNIRPDYPDHGPALSGRV